MPEKSVNYGVVCIFPAFSPLFILSHARRRRLTVLYQAPIHLFPALSVSTSSLPVFMPSARELAQWRLCESLQGAVFSLSCSFHDWISLSFSYVALNVAVTHLYTMRKKGFALDSPLSSSAALFVSAQHE